MSYVACRHMPYLCRLRGLSALGAFHNPYWRWAPHAWSSAWDREEQCVDTGFPSIPASRWSRLIFRGQVLVPPLPRLSALSTINNEGELLLYPYSPLRWRPPWPTKTDSKRECHGLRTEARMRQSENSTLSIRSPNHRPSVGRRTAHLISQWQRNFGSKLRSLLYLSSSSTCVGRQGMPDLHWERCCRMPWMQGQRSACCFHFPKM